MTLQAPALQVCGGGSYARASNLLCCRPDGLELSTGQPLRPGSSSYRQLLKTNFFNRYSTHSAVEMMCDFVLYKYTIDIDIDSISHLQWFLILSCDDLKKLAGCASLRQEKSGRTLRWRRVGSGLRGTGVTSARGTRC